MPAYNASAHLRTVLPAAMRAAKGREIVVVDPGSSDDSAEIAEELGARVIRLGRRAGPAEARNEGVKEIETDLVLFIDSDCVAHEDVVDRVVAAFREDPGLVSLTGSYDDDPPDPGFFSQYMNLRHHRTHQRARRENASFWAGCGAVRTSAYREVGGFDAIQFPRPMIEDIELSLRLRKTGRTGLDPDLKVTHLKRWTMASVIGTDVKQRAIPWSRLIARSGDVPNDLNLKLSQRVAALVAPFALLSVVAIPVLLLLAPIWAILPGAVLLTALALNFDLAAFFAKRRGILFGVGGFLFHQVHLVYSAATFLFVMIGNRLGGSKAKAGNE